MSWMGPAELCSRYRGRNNVKEEIVAAVLEGEPMTLMQAAASMAFGDLDASCLKLLCDANKVAYEDTSTLCLLEALVKHAWPEWSEEQILECLSKRLHVA
eukprot:3417288-Amphidinium_carterae.1